jgi:hypothetical protein
VLHCLLQARISSQLRLLDEVGLAEQDTGFVPTYEHFSDVDSDQSLDWELEQALAGDTESEFE